ncbi:hypothetical protein JIG36_46815 [Actinoplanes sp. LDG1-06]|uniref:Uncharacterized protein n=1 Tax=Paractinoplanes ovalisporus TaxID=2810368 RepID=A0ABS2AT67_9ACTN|nr:DUF6114 domain-containing protein [Actinoplanes ovalisporus]MBM2623037.1 hypothetical protein [Actinoplanes ovalisporus]
MAQDSFWSRFRRWRRRRPFWGGFFLVLAALELLYTANMNLGNLEVHLGPQGFLSYLLPMLLLLCGLLSWFSPAQRVFYGIIGLLTALYTFLGLNLGGFFVGMLLGIVGGALVIAWGPPRVRPAPPTDGPDPDDEPVRTDRDQQVRRSTQLGDSTIIPGMNDGRFKNPRALSIVLLVTAVTGSVLVAGSSLPARAEECPEGLPSRTSETPSAPASSAASPSGRESLEPTPAAPGDSKPGGGSKSAAPSSSASASPGAEDEGTGNPILDGIGDFFDGVGDLLGIGDKESPAPSASPTPSKNPLPAAPSPSASASSSKAARSSAPVSASASASVEEIPCLGPRVMDKVASADDIPRVAVEPGVMKVDSLTMYESTYGGVVDMPTAKGSFKALKFSMDKAVNKPFTLTMNEPGRAQTVIKSNELVTDGNVRFYTPEFKGNLFGLIPVTFTPESPPPLTLPVLWFTNVTIKLAYVRCDVLTADPLDIREKLTAAS